MARDFEDLHDTDNLGDDELRELVRSHLASNESLDADDINVHVESGQVRLLGRVGTEGEARIAEHIVTDVLGLMEVSNELVVDPLRRAESADGLGGSVADERDSADVLRGDRVVPLNADAAHLDEDPDASLFGSRDLQTSLEQGDTWSPPDSPTPEGMDDSADSSR